MSEQTKDELVAAVREHAQRNWGESAWDVVHECWDDAHIAEVIGDAKTIELAISRVREIVSVLDDVRGDVYGEIF